MKVKSTVVFVYVIACGDQVKVGISNNPANRLKELATGMPFRPVLFHKRAFETRADAREIEQQLHWKFRANKSHREWFTIRAQQAKNALAAATLRRNLPGTASQRVAAMFDRLKEQPDLLH